MALFANLILVGLQQKPFFFSKGLRKLREWSQLHSLSFFPIGESQPPLSDQLKLAGLKIAVSPIQADCLIIGTSMNAKMASYLRTIFDTMREPKWVWVLGPEASSGAPFYGPTTLAGIHHLLPVHLHSVFKPLDEASLLQPLEVLKGRIKDNEKRTTDPLPEKFPDLPLESVCDPLTTRLTQTLRFVPKSLGHKTTWDSDIGYHFRGLELALESRPILQIPTLIGQWDPYQIHFSTRLFCEAIESILEIEIPERAKMLRHLFCELNRISCHLFSVNRVLSSFGEHQLSAHLKNVCIRITQWESQFSKSTFRHSPICLGGLKFDLTRSLSQSLRSLNNYLSQNFEWIQDLIETNPAWIQRARHFGSVSKAQALEYGLTGPNLRATGIYYDGRMKINDSLFQMINLQIPVGFLGDAFDRLFVRLNEMFESLRIIETILNYLPYGPWLGDHAFSKIYGPKSETSNELWLDLPLKDGFIYHSIEAATGEMGLFLQSNKSPFLTRMRLRSPSFPLVDLIQSLGQTMNVETLALLTETFGLQICEIDR